MQLRVSLGQVLYNTEAAVARQFLSAQEQIRKAACFPGLNARNSFNLYVGDSTIFSRKKPVY